MMRLFSYSVVPMSQRVRERIDGVHGTIKKECVDDVILGDDAFKSSEMR